MVVLINLDTFDTIHNACPHKLMELGLPEGYVDASEVTLKWIAAGQKLKESLAAARTL